MRQTIWEKYCFASLNISTYPHYHSVKVIISAANVMGNLHSRNHDVVIQTKHLKTWKILLIHGDWYTNGLSMFGIRWDIGRNWVTQTTGTHSIYIVSSQIYNSFSGARWPWRHYVLYVGLHSTATIKTRYNQKITSIDHCRGQCLPNEISTSSPFGRLFIWQFNWYRWSRKLSCFY